MENATKAMFIAAGVLIGVMILSLGAALFAELSSYVESSHERMEFNELNKFNTQFTKYINDREGERQFEVTIHDVITAANLAYENNVKYNTTSDNRGNPSNAYVTVRVDGTAIEDDINEDLVTLLQNKMAEGINSKKYKCKPEDVKMSEVTGRVYEINFHSY